MRVLLATIGSSGDIRPFIWLAQRLERLGHEATLMAASYFRPMIESYGVTCLPLDIETDPALITDRPSSMARFKGTGVVLKEMIFPHYPMIARETIAAIERSRPDLVLYHQIMLAAAWGAEVTDVRRGCVSMAPASWPSRLNPNRYPMMPDRDVYRDWLVRAGLGAAHHVTGWMFDPILNKQRRALGLQKQRCIVTRASLEAHVNLGMWSGAYRAPAEDDPPLAHTIGFPFLDDPDEAWERTDPALRAFVEAGSPPVAITLGSTASLLPGSLHERLVEGCRAIGRRAVVLAPESSAPDQADDVCVLSPSSSSTPHAGVLRHACCAIVHGGIGTTAEALRAGCPSVVVPHAHDQFDNARRARLMGASVTLPKDRADGERIATTITSAINACTQGAARASQRIRDADAEADARLVAALDASGATPTGSRSDHATSVGP